MQRAALHQLLPEVRPLLPHKAAASGDQQASMDRSDPGPCTSLSSSFGPAGQIVFDCLGRYTWIYRGADPPPSLSYIYGLCH